MKQREVVHTWWHPRMGLKCFRPLALKQKVFTHCLHILGVHLLVVRVLRERWWRMLFYLESLSYGRLHSTLGSQVIALT